MKTLRDRAERYLRTLDAGLSLSDQASFPALPLVLRERYELRRARLFGYDWLLAIEAEDWDAGSPTEYRQHWEQLSQITGEEYVALVLPFITSTIRNRMIGHGIPFVVPNTQIHLPLHMISLRESVGAPRSMGEKPLPPAAQALLLIQLQQGQLQNRSSKDIASLTGYSRATTSMACAELEQRHLSRSFRKGKELRMEFGGSSHELWKLALPLLRSPVRKTLLIRGLPPTPPAKMAGISALATLSDLAADRFPTFALPDRAVREGFEHGKLQGCPDRYEADAELQAWMYDPALLTPGENVDDLSLYLSLRDHPDERVQAALMTMMEERPWR